MTTIENFEFIFKVERIKRYDKKLFLWSKLEADPMLSPMEKAQRKASIMLEVSVAATTSSGGSSITTLSNGIFSSFGQGSDQMDSISKYLKLLIINVSKLQYE